MKKIAILFVIFSFCLLLSSCGADEAETEILYPGETVLLEDGSPIYAEDAHLEEYISKYYYPLRREGNPDPKWERLEVGSNGEGYTFELTEEVYSLSNGPDKWGVRVCFTSDTYLAGKWISRLNLEKYEDGKWVRQAILSPGHIYANTQTQIEAVKNNGIVLEGSLPFSSEDWQEGLMLLSPLMVKVDTICPAPTPGKYRFVFYAQLWQEEYDKNPENRMYYIPFEVVE